MLYLYSGDLISPSLLSGIDKGANTIELTNLVPFDVAVPGNHEFDFGPDVFTDRLARIRVPLDRRQHPRRRRLRRSPVSAREPVIKEIAGVKFGIVPVATDETPVLATPGDWTWAPTVDAALAGADEVIAQGADIVIALVHAAHAQDDAMYDSGKFDLDALGSRPRLPHPLQRHRRLRRNQQRRQPADGDRPRHRAHARKRRHQAHASPGVRTSASSTPRR